MNFRLFSPLGTWDSDFASLTPSSLWYAIWMVSLWSWEGGLYWYDFSSVDFFKPSLEQDCRNPILSFGVVSEHIVESMMYHNRTSEYALQSLH